MPWTCAPPAIGSYVSAVAHNGFLYVSGHGPYRDGEYIYRGKVDSAVPFEEARAATELTVLNALGSARKALGSLDREAQVVKVLGIVNSDPDFARQPRVIDGASDLLVRIFGDQGRHARSAVGMCALPMGICAKIEMIMAFR